MSLRGSAMSNGKTSDKEVCAGLLQTNDSAKEGTDEEDGVIPQVMVTAANQLESSGTQISLGKRGTTEKRPSMGSFRTGHWKLKYQDFLPPVDKDKSDVNWTSTMTFQKLVDMANDWLRKNPHVQVKTCQTVIWISHDAKNLGSGGLMVISKSIAENTLTYFLRGLRVWLEPRGANKKQQTLCCTDFLPDAINNNIPSLIDEVNRKIARKQIKGQIITVESVGYPCSSDDGKVDPKATKWTESMNDDVPYAFLVRVFHVREANERAHIIKKTSTPPILAGVKDFVPQEKEEGYEAFENLIERANTWLKDQSDIQIVNMQSIMAQKNNEVDMETGSYCFYSMPGINTSNPVDFFRILRLAYVTPPSDHLVDIPVIYPFTYETFTPELIKEKETSTERLEKMNETFSKVMAFLRNSGADVINAEMVFNPMQLYSSTDNAQGSDEMKFLYTIRLYLTGQISHIDGSVRSIKRGSVASARSRVRGSPAAEETRGGRTGPIFLRSVVNRQFKYRWLVLALSTISCMSIIVIVSVVYSNR